MQLGLTPSSKAILQDATFHNTLFIFDVDYMPYSQIFEVMNTFRKNNNQFRIRPPKCNFVLGSDQSDEKGSVTVF